MLQFKWQDPEETGGRPITRYQALALRPGSGSDLDPAAVGGFAMPGMPVCCSSLCPCRSASAN